VTGLGSPNFNVIANLVLNNATAFPSVGAYPDGGATPAAVYYNDNDDGDDKEIRTSALVISIVALVLGLIALIIGSYLLCGRKGSETAPRTEAARNPMSA
jgi:hypothetical protein